MRESLVLLTVVATALAAWHDVSVGLQGPGFAFTPATVVALVNDALHFIILDPNITVIQSAGLDAPCTPLPGGFRSVSGLGKIDLTIFDNSPIYAYAAPHCAEGMVFIANPRQASDLATMQRNARALAAPPPAQSESDETSVEHGGTSSTPVTTSTPSPVVASQETPTTPIPTRSGSSVDDAQSSAPNPEDVPASSGQTAQQSEQIPAQRETSPGLLAGVIVGCVAGTTLVLLVVVFLCRRRSHSGKALHLEPSSQRAELSCTPLTLGSAESCIGGWQHGRKRDSYAGPPPAYMPFES